MSGLGIVAALPAEARCLAPGRAVPVPGRSLPFPGSGTLLVCGIGPARAQAAAEALLAGGARALLSWGTAGGLDPGLQPGALCLPETVVDADGARFLPDPAWRWRLQETLPPELPVHEGLVAASGSVLASTGEKESLRARTGAAAVDTESGALARAAAEAEIPFLVVRAVVDPAGEALPRCVFAAVDSSGQMRPAALLTALCRRPQEAISLVRLARHFGAARRTLTVVARAAGARSFLSCAAGGAAE